MDNFTRNFITPVKNKKDYISSKEFVCQIFDYQDSNEEYEEGKQFVITLFGVNKEGNSICVIVDGFKPFFYVKAPEGITDVNKFLVYLKIHAGRKHFYAYNGIIKEECTEEKKKNFYGYQTNKELFFKIVFKDSLSFYMIKKILNEPIMINNTERRIQIFEGNFDPVLRFFHMRNIAPCGWVSLKDYEYEEGTSNCQIEIRLHWESLSGIEDDSMAPIIQASYDIECYSINPDVFPQPEIEGNVVTQIATAFKKYGDKDFFLKHIITLKKCSPILNKEGETPIVVESYDTEAEVLRAWKNLLLSTDPDIIYSYNGDGFDGNYLYKRAEISGVKNEFLKYGKLKFVSGKLNETTFSSGAYGSTDYKRLIIPGRVNFDLLIYINREFKLPSYKLDFVAETYLNENKNPLTPRQMFEYFEDGHPDKIKIIAEYCIQDTLLPQKLIDKLNVLINQVEMAKITLVPIKFLWERGQQIKVFSQIIKRTAQKDFLIPTRVFTKDFIADDEEKFQGATVLDPKTGAYFEPVVTLDFQSLYPSIIRAHNFCYSTFVLDNKNHEDSKVETEYIEWEDDMGKYKYGFVQNREISVLPELLSDLFNARVAVRKKMKDITDEFLLGVLDKKQLAIKVSMNSVYGFLASQMIKCKPIAACVTAVGRQMILKTKNYIESNYQGSSIIYGDTDSVFVKFNLQHLPKEEQMVEAFKLGKESADKATNILFKKPIKLEFEKVFNPLLLFGKKMYIGQLYSSSPNKPDYTDKKGVVSKRRDNAPIVKRVYNQTVNIIMEQGNEGVSKAIDYIKFELQNLLLDKVNINELTLSKTLKSKYKSQNLPHKIVAEKMAERDPGSAPKSNDRVEYVFIENESKKQFEKAEDPQFVIKNGLKLDSLYYIEHQLQNPLCQVLELVTENPEEVFSSITSAYKIKQKERLLRQKQDREGQSRITSFFKKKTDIKE